MLRALIAFLRLFTSRERLEMYEQYRKDSKELDKRSRYWLCLKQQRNRKMRIAFAMLCMLILSMGQAFAQNQALAAYFLIAVSETNPNPGEMIVDSWPGYTAGNLVGPEDLVCVNPVNQHQPTCVVDFVMNSQVAGYTVTEGTPSYWYLSNDEMYPDTGFWMTMSMTQQLNIPQQAVYSDDSNGNGGINFLINGGGSGDCAIGYLQLDINADGHAGLTCGYEPVNDANVHWITLNMQNFPHAGALKVDTYPNRSVLSVDTFYNNLVVAGVTGGNYDPWSGGIGAIGNIQRGYGTLTETQLNMMLHCILIGGSYCQVANGPNDTKYLPDGQRAPYIHAAMRHQMARVVYAREQRLAGNLAPITELRRERAALDAKYLHASNDLHKRLRY